MEWIHLVGFFFFHFNFLCIKCYTCIVYLCFICVPGARGGQRSLSKPLGVELQVAVSFFVRPLALGE